jgi:hypothetical protein
MKPMEDVLKTVIFDYVDMQGHLLTLDSCLETLLTCVVLNDVSFELGSALLNEQRQTKRYLARRFHNLSISHLCQ